MAKKIIKRGGTEFFVDIQNDVEENFWSRYENDDWETATLNFLQNNIRGGYFLDIGSWIGPITLLMAEKYEKIISVDLDPVANEKFSINVKLNKFSNIDHYAIGLGKKTEHLTIDAGKLGSSLTNIFESSSTETIKVKIVRFEEFISSLPKSDLIRFIKIDCEGAEYTFLDQIYKFISNKDVFTLISYHPWVIKKPNYYFTKFYHWMRQLRFNRYYFTTDNSTIVKRRYVPLFVLRGEKFPMADIIKA